MASTFIDESKIGTSLAKLYLSKVLELAADGYSDVADDLGLGLSLW